MKNDSKKKKKKSNAEKPVSLAGATFKEVLAALLKTPKPKETIHGKEKKAEEKKDGSED